MSAASRTKKRRGASTIAAEPTLDQIGALLDGDRPGRRSVLEEHLLSIDERERELERSRPMTEHALRCEAHDIVTCPRFADGRRRGARWGVVDGWS